MEENCVGIVEENVWYTSQVNQAQKIVESTVTH